MSTVLHSRYGQSLVTHVLSFKFSFIINGKEKRKLQESLPLIYNLQTSLGISNIPPSHLSSQAAHIKKIKSNLGLLSNFE